MQWSANPFMAYLIQNAARTVSKNADNPKLLTLTCNWHLETCVQTNKIQNQYTCVKRKSSRILLIFLIIIFPTKHYKLKYDFYTYTPLPLFECNIFKFGMI